MIDKILTLIIPSYNMEKYLDRCLSSLIVGEELMTYFEALVINDGSKDRTSEIGHRFEARYPNTFRVIDKENGHYGSCVNRGISEASGTFVKILDADDQLERTAFHDFLLFLQNESTRQNADLVLSAYAEIDEDGHLLKKHTYDDHNCPFSLGQLSPGDRMNWFIHGLTYRTKLLKDMEYHQSEGIAYTDHEWAVIPLPFIKTIFCFKQVLYLYSVGRDGQSISSEKHAANLQQEIEVVKSILNHYNSLPLADSEKDQSFIRETVYANVENVYRLYLVDLPARMIRTFRPLEEFDAWLKTEHPTIYQQTANFQTSAATIRFSTISDWRNGRLFHIWLQRFLHQVAFVFNYILSRLHG